MSPKRYLVVSRGPAALLHFDVVIARNEALAEDRVRQMRKGLKVKARDRAKDPVALSVEEVRSILDAMVCKGSEDVEKKFQSLLK